MITECQNEQQNEKKEENISIHMGNIVFILYAHNLSTKNTLETFFHHETHKKKYKIYVCSVAIHVIEYGSLLMPFHICRFRNRLALPLHRNDDL